MFAANTDTLLTLFKICLLVLLYLFMLRVIRAVWSEITIDGAEVGAAPKSRRRRSADAAPPAGPQGLRAQSPDQLANVLYPLIGTVTVGRAMGSTIWLEDSYLSHNHARFSCLNEQWFVEDLGSTNGTFVNDTQIDAPAPIAVGDVIRMGQITTVVE